MNGVDKAAIREMIVRYLRENVAANRVGQVHDLRVKYREAFGQHVADEQELLVLETLNEFVLSGVVSLGSGIDAPGYPWLWVTTFGREALRSGGWLPHDPDGFIRETTARLPGLDATALRYLREAVAGYARDLLLSSSVMLGVASEQLMLNLIAAFGRWREVDPARFDAATAGRGIYERYTEFRKRLDPKLELLDPALRGDLDAYLEGLFNLIRLVRNVAGHPTETAIPKNVLYANIQAFPEYAERLMRLTEFFDANRGT